MMRIASTLLLLGAMVALTATGALAQSKPRPCSLKGSVTLASDDQIRIFERVRPSTTTVGEQEVRTYGCLSRDWRSSVVFRIRCP